MSASIDCTIYAPAGAPAGKLVQVEALGARLVRVPGPRQATTDAVLAARARIPAGESERFCGDCGEPIPEKRRAALPGVKTCIACQSGIDRAVSHSAINRRGSKDSQLR